MSRLAVFADDAPAGPIAVTTEPAEIAARLATIGVAFERWRAGAEFAPDADDTAILEAYGADITRLKAAGGYQSVDIIRVTPATPDTGALRARFLAEHTHSDDEVRFFVEGAAQFYLHKADQVFAMVCEAGDLISVPAGTRHWFDMGERPRFAAIRLFVSPEGWVARFTGEAIADAFPKYEPVA